MRPLQRKRFSTTGFLSEYAVSFRRISGDFINDEDWGLTPWSWQTYEPSDVKGQIGPKTHERILSYCFVCVPIPSGRLCMAVLYLLFYTGQQRSG